MKRIQNLIDCVLVLSRRHTVYCTARTHFKKTLSLDPKREKQIQKKGKRRAGGGGERGDGPL